LVWCWSSVPCWSRAIPSASQPSWQQNSTLQLMVSQA
jgi:hypothetical protein